MYLLIGMVVLAASALVGLSGQAFAANAPAAEVGGAKVGMGYATARAKILAAGFKPMPKPKDHYCGYNDQCSLPETDASAGTGAGQCSYVFRKGNRILEVSGINGREGKPLSQTVNAIQFRRR